MIGQRHTIARLQSNFYQENYHRILRWVLVLVVLVWVLIFAIIAKFVSYPAPTYYATTSEGKIIHLQPVQIK